MTQENPVATSTNSSMNPPSNFQLALAAAELAASTRCNNVIVLDLRGRSPVTEFFVIATGTSARQMRTVADELEDLGKKVKFTVWQKSGYDSAKWILVDFVHVVVHIFDGDSRGFYDLEMLWGDAPRIDWRKELGLPPEEVVFAEDNEGVTGLDAGGWEDTPETEPVADAGHDDYIAGSEEAATKAVKKPVKKAAKKPVAKKVAKKAPVKKAVAKKAVKKVAPKKATKKIAKKPAAKKAASKKAPAKKAVAKKTVKKAVAKKVVKKAPAKKAVAKKAVKKVAKKKK